MTQPYLILEVLSWIQNRALFTMKGKGRYRRNRNKKEAKKMLSPVVGLMDIRSPHFSAFHHCVEKCLGKRTTCEKKSSDDAVRWFWCVSSFFQIIMIWIWCKAGNWCPLSAALKKAPGFNMQRLEHIPEYRRKLGGSFQVGILQLYYKYILFLKQV